MQSHSFVRYPSAEFKSKGPGTLDKSGPYFGVWYSFRW